MNLTKDPISTLIIKLSAPAVFAVMFDVLYNVTGVYFAGLISTSAVAGLSMSFLLYMAVVGVGSGFASALTALVGNALGAGRENLAKIYATQGAFFVLVFSVCAGLLGFKFAPKVLVFLGANNEFLPEATAYVRVIFLATPFFMLIKTFNGILVALGDTKTLRNWLFFGLFINFILCFLFVKTLNLGVSFIALSTAIVQAVGTLFMAKKVAKRQMIEFLNFSSFAPNLAIYTQILRQAIPSCLNHLSMSFGGLVMLKFVSFYGTDAVAGYGIALRVEQIVGLPTIGIASAVMSVVARNYGAREFGRVRECYKAAIKIVLYYCLFGCAFCVFFGVHIVALFEASSAAISVGQGFLLTVAFVYFGYGVMNVSGGVLQAVRRPFVVFVLNFIRQIILQTIVFSLIVFVWQGAVADVWLGMAFNVYVTALCFLCYTLYTLRRVCGGKI